MLHTGHHILRSEKSQNMHAMVHDRSCRTLHSASHQNTFAGKIRKRTLEGKDKNIFLSPLRRMQHSCESCHSQGMGSIFVAGSSWSNTGDGDRYIEALEGPFLPRHLYKALTG